MVTMSDSQSATVEELWCYPVKSMRGERIDESDVTTSGLAGDRAYAVVDSVTGKVGSAKHPRLWGRLLQCEARYHSSPLPDAPRPPVSIRLPNGEETGSEDPEVDRRLSAVFGRPVRLTSVAPDGSGYLAVWPEMEGVIPDDYLQQISVDGSEPEGTLSELSLALASAPGTFFDVAALHVLTTETLRHLAALQPASRFEVRRFRPNIVIGSTDPPFIENSWPGAVIRFGTALEATVLLATMRCIMTTLAQGGLPRDNEVLRTVSRHNRIELPGLGTWSCVGAYAAVAEPGKVHIGDEVVVDHPVRDVSASGG
jgi:hypothetical protein